MRLPQQRQVLLDLAIVGVPQVAIVARVLDNDFVRTDGLHPVVESVAGALGLAFNAVNGTGMHHGASRPGIAVRRWARTTRPATAARLPGQKGQP